MNMKTDIDYDNSGWKDDNISFSSVWLNVDTPLDSQGICSGGGKEE